MPGYLLRILCAALVAAAASISLPADAHVASCARSIPFAGEWPMFGRDVKSSRSQVAEKFINRDNVSLLAPAWTFDADRASHETKSEITGYPIVQGGCVYAGTSTGNDGAGRHRPGWVFALNADSGDVVWQTKVRGGVFSTLAASGGVVYAFVSRVSSPYVVALDQATGRILWETVVDTQPGSDAVSSPVVYDGLVWVGVSGTAAEGDENDRFSFQGSSVLLATRPITGVDSGGHRRSYRPGDVVRKVWSIPPSQWHEGYAGAAQWGTIAVDPESGYGYVGTGNPFDYTHEHPNTNAVLKIDMNRSRRTFGRIVSSYKGDVEAYVNEASGIVPCEEIDEVEQTFAAGLECVRLDLDFGATPNIVRQPNGRKVIVVGQKSGVVHIVDAATMRSVTKVRLGVPSPVGGMVGSGATDGTNVFGTHTVGGYLYSLSTEGSPQWVAPVPDAIHWGPPVTHANGVVYTVDLKGFLDAYDAKTGLPLLHRPLAVGPDSATIQRPPLSWGGVSVAQHKVFVTAGVGLTSAGLPSVPGGFLIAFALPGPTIPPPGR